MAKAVTATMPRAFDPALASPATRLAVAGLFSLADGIYLRSELARAMAEPSGVQERWAAEVLRWLSVSGVLGRAYVRRGGRHRAVVVLSGHHLRAALGEHSGPRPRLRVAPMWPVSS